MIIFLYIGIISAVPVIAELIRPFVEVYLKDGTVVNAIPGVLKFTYSENRGVAFGLFQDGTVFFAIATAVVIIVASFLLVRYHSRSVLFSVAASLIIGGGLGNLYERVFLGYVVDYIQLSFFPPVCNFADYCITAGTICLIVYLLFFSDLLKSKKAKEKAQHD